MRITLEGLRQFNVPKSIVTAAQKHMIGVLQQGADQTAGSNLDDEGDEEHGLDIIVEETPDRAIELSVVSNSTQSAVSNSTGSVE